jgi:hypothetical protein
MIHMSKHLKSYPPIDSRIFLYNNVSPCPQDIYVHNRYYWRLCTGWGGGGREISSQFIVPDWGDKVDFGIGLW